MPKAPADRGVEVVVGHPRRARAHGGVLTAPSRATADRAVNKQSARPPLSFIAIDAACSARSRYEDLRRVHARRGGGVAAERVDGACVYGGRFLRLRLRGPQQPGYSSTPRFRDFVAVGPSLL